MILVTVGSAPHPFPRLVDAAERLAQKTGHEVVIQYGFTRPVLKFARGFDFVPYEEMLSLFQKADVIISHASAGPILFAGRYQKPLILFPRSGDLNEHVDNHQIDFSKAMQHEGAGFEIVFEAAGLEAALERISKAPYSAVSHNRTGMTEVIRQFLDDPETARRESSGRWGLRKIKELLYYLRIYRFLASLRSHTFWLLRNGYTPKDFWNRWSARYIHEKSRGAIGASHAWLFEKIRQYPLGAKVLEAGVAYGRTIAYLYEKTGCAMSFYGADISYAMLDYGRKHLPAQLASHIVCSDITALPYPDGAFDIVFTRGVLMHCPQDTIEKAISELERVAKGEMILIEEAFWNDASHRGPTFSLNDYTFIHDYSSILARKGWQISEKKVVDEGMVALICMVCHKDTKNKMAKTAEVELPEPIV